ncbi:MAG: 23S rRNA (pseudouridine(1915)-N(3))-methyltransferase RlmH, partial [Methylohalobius sp.]|nr:23S rRNA (pseudouridine(1915)-N(3))-methyltransferase RlmH [Methylohalobius sp.]
MRIYLIAAGNRMPSWVQEGFAEYAQRLPKEWAVCLKEIPLKRIHGRDLPRQIHAEGVKINAAIPD